MISHYRKHKKRWGQGLVLLLVVGAIIAIGGVITSRRFYTQNLKGVSTNEQTKTVVVPQGFTLKQTANLLKQEGVIRNSLVFEQYVRNKNAADKIKAGTYELSPSQSVSEIVAILTEGLVQTNLVTILPGQTLAGIKSALTNAGFDPAAVDIALNPDLYKGNPALVDKPAGASLEGYLYPESFQKTADTTPKEIVTSALKEMEKRLTPEFRSSVAKQGLSVYQAISLASIIEKEVSVPSDRAQVAQVFLKRISMGKNLESDVTAFYGASLAGQPRSVLYDSPYNTYLHGGVTPGPISNVSQSSLTAVANPATTDWLYFVAGDDGKTYFSRTLAEHEALSAQYCIKGCGR